MWHAPPSRNQLPTTKLAHGLALTARRTSHAYYPLHSYYPLHTVEEHSAVRSSEALTSANARSVGGMLDEESLGGRRVDSGRSTVPDLPVSCDLPVKVPCDLPV